MVLDLTGVILIEANSREGFENGLFRGSTTALGSVSGGLVTDVGEL